MPLNLLSLDLDWFNGIDTPCIPSYIAYFFRRLRSVCVLPKDITVMTGHHYLLPWCVHLRQLHRARTVHVSNLDAHHDFYRLDTIKDFGRGKVTEGNFFAFMAHYGLLHRYTWVTNRTGLAVSFMQRPELLEALRVCTSRRVRRLRHTATVRRMLDVWDVVEGATFHGFAVVRSPDYTRTELVTACVRRVLRRDFVGRGFFVRHIAHRAEFAYSRMPHAAVSGGADRAGAAGARPSSRRVPGVGRPMAS